MRTNEQTRWSLNVWGGIIGTYFIEKGVTGQVNLQFLQNELLGLTNLLPEYVRN